MMHTSESHRLISMTQFVLEYYSHEGYADLHTLELMNNYANFLKKPLTLGMLVPIDPEGNILKEPRNYSIWKELKHNNGEGDVTAGFEQHRIYQLAERRLLFEGFKIAYNGYSVVRVVAAYNENIELSFRKNDLMSASFSDIESLTGFNEIYLTSSALKIIGIKTDI